MRRYAAEAIGTFAVVFMGCGAALVGGDTIGDAGVAVAFGLGLAVMMLALGPVSGGYVNPAVTVGAALAGRLRAREVAPYIAAQLSGGVAGAALVVAMANGRPGENPLWRQTLVNGYDRLSPGFYGLKAALIAEVVLSALFVLVVLGASSGGAAGASSRAPHSASLDGGPNSRGFSARAFLAGPTAALAAGACYALIHLVGLPVTRMGANPARSLGPALLVGGSALEQVWVFLAAPLVGAVIAAFVYRGVFGLERAERAERADGPASRDRPRGDQRSELV
jgi:aquaporin Z